MAISPFVFRVVTAVVVTISAVFCVLSTAGNYWIEDEGNNLNEGLWKTCVNGTCTEIEGGVDTLRATKTLMVMSCLSFVFAFGYGILLHVARDLNIKFLALILAVTFLLQVVALSLYAGNSDLGGKAGYEFGWAYVMGWCSTITAVIGAVLCVFDNGYTELE